MVIICKKYYTDTVITHINEDRDLPEVNQIPDQDSSINIQKMKIEIPIEETKVLQIQINPLGNITKQRSFENSTLPNEPSTLGYKEKLEKFLNSSEITSLGIDLDWIVAKIRQEIEEWEITRKLVEKRGLLEKITEKTVLLLMGLLDIDMGKDALKGGPVGELVQWSNLIVALNILGHRIEIVKNEEQFEHKMRDERHYDIIITDYLGLFRISESRYFQNLCKFRILDSFGTDPQFNIRTYTMLGKGLYDKWSIPDTRQIWTYLPLNQDNSFLGVMVPFRQHIPNSTNSTERKKIALVYGKVASYFYFFPNTVNVLKLISEYMEIHLTMSPDEGIEKLPFRTTNHGVLSQNELSDLLDQTHLFVGLGFPFIGPGPFDALAHGCTFLQPYFNSPKNRNTDPFFDGKPTMLTLNSQHSYLEKYGDREYVFTVDYDDIELVKGIVEKVAKMTKLPPYIPYEFTGVGFVDRLAILTEKLNICNKGNLALGKVPTLADGIPLDSTNGIKLVTDGVWSMDSCYNLEKRDSNKPYINIGFDNIIWAWEIKLKLLPTWNVMTNNPSAHIYIELLSESGLLFEVRSFVVDRVSIEWLWVNTSSVANVRLYSDVSINICELEVYGKEDYQQLWPSIDTLKVKYSKPGEACSTTCFTHELICARNLFPMLDSIDYLNQYFDCNNYRTDIVGPAVEVSESSKRECILNKDPMLYSCIAHQDSVVRVCPCVLKHPGQNGLPLATDFN